MKNFKLLKRGAALLTATTISLSLAGCDSYNREKEEDVSTKNSFNSSHCLHLDIRFGNVVETFF